MRIVVTVDTEADGQWDHGRPVSTANVAAWPPFQELCHRHAAPPVYLITSEIARDRAAVAFLRPLIASGEAEVGAHLHPWTTPPFVDEPGLRENDRYHAYPSHLEPDLLRAKLETLTAQIEDACGRRPTSYRAGRFGLDATGACALVELGYEVDSSVTPYLTWADHSGRPGRAGGPDFRRHDARPFRIAGTGTPALLELPVTVMPTYALTRRFPWLLEHWHGRPGFLKGRGQRMLPRPQPIWLRPRPEYVLDDLQALLIEAERVGLSCAVFMFHSSELLAGGSPYRETQADIDRLLSLLDELFAWSRSRGHEFLTLSGAAQEVTADGELPEKAL